MNHVAFVLEPLAPVALRIPRVAVPFALSLMAMHSGLEQCRTSATGSG
jgi:hypothetical protein